MTEEEAIAAATRARGCECGRVFIGSAYDVHRDGGRCLPDHMTESLIELRDGVYRLRGSGTTRR